MGSAAGCAWWKASQPERIVSAAVAPSQLPMADALLFQVRHGSCKRCGVYLLYQHRTRCVWFHMKRSPAILAFITRHSHEQDDVPTESQVAVSASDIPGSTQELEAALRLAVELARASGDLERAVMWQDPPHASYQPMMKRLQERARSRGWSWKSPESLPPNDV